MTGAMYAAIAGLKTHMQKLNVIGHNIANVNTNGYKSQRTIFQDAMYTMYSSGSDGTTTTGGRNPSQIGYGSQISTIDLDMTTGSYAPGNSLDCMIYGDGFFLVGDKDVASVIDPLDPTSIKSLMMSRVGDFSFKADGYLSDGRGNVVYGFQCTGTDPETGKPIVSDQLVPIRLPKMETVDTYTRYEYNKDTSTWSVATTTTPLTEKEYQDYLTALETAGTPEDLGYRIDKATTYEIRYPIDDDGTNTIPLQDYDAPDGTMPFAQMDSITINQETGAITGTTKDTDQLVTIGYIAIGNVTNPNGVTHDGGFYYTAGDGSGDLQVSLMGGVAEDLGIEYVNGSLYEQTLKQMQLDGELTDANNDGKVDDNDVTYLIEQGQSQKLLIGSAGGTNLMTGGLEGSNVDLATEISELITTQRGYQANTRIITVTDSMLEELVNMKR